MLSFLRRVFVHKDVRQVVDMLDEENNAKKYATARNYILTYGGLKDNQHKNSYLTYSIVWAKENAAIDLLTHCERQGLNYKDQFASSRSTALILCAKTGLNKVAMLLIGLGANVDEVDYRGFSALHYACLYRNTPLICALLETGAAANRPNKFGKLPLDYYKMDFTFSDLHYFYGSTANFSLVHCCDWDDSFQGTKHPDLSAIRWFITNLIVNFKIGLDKKIPEIESDCNAGTKIYISWDKTVTLSQDQKNGSVYDFAKNQLVHRKAVTDIRLYNAMMINFCEYRNNITLDQQILDSLEPSFTPNDQLQAAPIEQSPLNLLKIN